MLSFMAQHKKHDLSYSCQKTLGLLTAATPPPVRNHQAGCQVGRGLVQQIRPNALCTVIAPGPVLLLNLQGFIRCCAGAAANSLS